MNSKLKDERELLSKPGDTILETLEFKKMSQAELAERMGRTPSKINDIISGKEPVSVNTALQLEKVLGIDAKFWLNREMLFREKLSRLDQEDALEECKEWLRTQPITELKKCGYIKAEKKNAAMVEELLQFYGVASKTQWEAIYVDQYAPADFRRSEKNEMAIGALSAWLRIGEIEMGKLVIKQYDKEVFKSCLLEIKKLIRLHPEDFAIRLKEYCLNAGVALVYTMCLPKAPISGAARWMGGNPLIQMTDRYKSNDHFWFTFFHEAAHIILHGKKDVFMDEFEAYVADELKEKEANEYANKTLVPSTFINEFSSTITEKDIRLVARKYDTHPAIILGQLQFKKLVPYYFASNLKTKIILDEVISKGE